MARTPFTNTPAGAQYEHITRLPVAVLLDNVRSLYKVGSFFRTGDAAGIEKLYLAGITGFPPNKALTKTALGSEERLPSRSDPYEVDNIGHVSLRASG